MAADIDTVHSQPRPGSSSPVRGQQVAAAALGMKGSRSADNLAGLAMANGSALCMATNSFTTPPERMRVEADAAIQRKLAGDASLFFDILSEGKWQS